jgi:hypothetical protein
MDNRKQTIEGSRNQSMSSGKTETKTMTINGRECTVEAKAIGFWIFKKLGLRLSIDP